MEESLISQIKNIPKQPSINCILNGVMFALTAISFVIGYLEEKHKQNMGKWETFSGYCIWICVRLLLLLLFDVCIRQLCQKDQGHTLRFFFKFVSRVYCSKIHPPNESPRKQKMLPWKSFWNKTTLKPLDFWAGEALEAWMRGCLNITSAQKWHAVIFQISAEKSFLAWQKSF